jgi:hypothetical protein
MDSLIDRGQYAGLADCRYLNQASLGLIPRGSLEASTRFLIDVAQHGTFICPTRRRPRSSTRCTQRPPSCSERLRPRWLWWAGQ